MFAARNGLGGTIKRYCHRNKIQNWVCFYGGYMAMLPDKNTYLLSPDQQVFSFIGWVYDITKPFMKEDRSYKCLSLKYCILQNVGANWNK